MPPRFKELYKPNPTGKDVRQRRLLREAQLRRLQREQLFMGKRLRFRTPQESETESEFEFTPSDTTNIIRGLKSAKHEERMEALKNLSAKLEQPSENLRGFVLDGACIELLVGVLAGTDSEEKLQSLWCLTNITGFEGRLAEQVLPATPYLVSLLDSHDMELKDQAAWTLGNLASEGPDIREHLYANGVLKPLVELAGTEDRTLLQTACFALSNMARKPSTYFDQMFEMGLPQAIAKQIQRFRGDVDCVRELAWVCAYLAAASSEQQVDVILETGAVDVILESALMAADQDGSAAQTSGLLIPAIRTLGNIAAGTDSQTRTLVSKPGFIRLVVRCIESSSSRAVEKESLWVLSSITACCKTDVDAVVNAGVVPDLVRIIEKQNFDLKKEAAYSLLNIAIVGQRIGDLPNEQLVKEFVEFVRSADEELVRMGVQFLSLLFEQLPGELGVEMLRKVEGGVDALETLIAVTEDDDIRATVSALIDQYYGDRSSRLPSLALRATTLSRTDSFHSTSLLRSDPTKTPVIKTPDEVKSYPATIKVYTRTGDKGTSSLFTGERRTKDDAVFESLGTTDELSSTIGLAIAFIEETPAKQLVAQLETIQCLLQDVGSNVATPLNSKSQIKIKRTRFDPDGYHCKQLEEWIDEMSVGLPVHRSFILPSGGRAAAALHVARTVCRRAERTLVPLKDDIDKETMMFVNRLSDYLFVAARWVAMKQGVTEKIYVHQQGRVTEFDK
ncbi:hypothetical protein H4R99_006659 [Coemansia sp. RSA 1722]|nr:hypothetical protein H4R99_006659 [Coemansia sp. RSA 1722]